MMQVFLKNMLLVLLDMFVFVLNQRHNKKKENKATWSPTGGRLGFVLFVGFGRHLVRCSSVTCSIGGSSPKQTGLESSEGGGGGRSPWLAWGGGAGSGGSSTWIGTSSRALSRSNSISVRQTEDKAMRESYRWIVTSKTVHGIKTHRNEGHVLVIKNPRKEPNTGFHCS